MEKRKFGGTGLEVSMLGFGGAEIGFEGAGVASVREILTRAIDAGLNVVDTAAAYLKSEELIGEALAGRRNEVVLMTKCGALDGFSREDWSPTGITRTIEGSLRRLQTDRLDIVFLHSCGEDVLRKGDAIAALQAARGRGLLRFLGYSGDGAAARYAVESGAFDVLQTSISIADQSVLEDVLPLARARNMGVVAKRPIANAAWRHATKPPNSYHHEYWNRLRKLKFDFTRDGAERAGEIALRFTLFQPGVHTAIVGTNKPGRWQQNAEVVAKGQLPAAQIEAIRARWREVADGSWVGQM